jgi:apolipoprotein N-acyltransferase
MLILQTLKNISKGCYPGLKPASLAGASGLLAALAFPPFNLWFILPFTMTPLWIFVRRLSPGKTLTFFWLWGIGLYLGSMYWLCYVMVNYGGLPFALAGLLFILLCLYMGLYVGLCGFIINFAKLGLTSAPLLWVAGEYARGQLLTGFPWLPLSLSLTSQPLLLQSADLWGSLGLSAMVVLLSVLLATVSGLTAKTSRTKKGLAAAAVLVIVGGGFYYGQTAIKELETQMAASPSAWTSFVQGNIPIDRLWQRNLRARNVMTQLALAQEAAASAVTRPWLILFSESAAPFAFLYDAENSMPFLQQAAALRAYMALGAIGAEQIQNRSVYSNRIYLVSPQGEPIDHYDKVHLVPFGEYVPLAKIFFFVRAIAALSVDMTPGTAGNVLKAENMIMGPLICYESIFPELAREHKRAHANLLLNPTNDSWFGPSGASSQHLAHLILRAVENRLSCVRAANTGISAFILPTGQVLDATELFTAASATRELPLLSRDTFFSRHGEEFFVKLALAFILLLPLCRLCYYKLKKHNKN